MKWSADLLRCRWTARDDTARNKNDINVRSARWASELAHFLCKRVTCSSVFNTRTCSKHISRQSTNICTRKRSSLSDAAVVRVCVWPWKKKVSPCTQYLCNLITTAVVTTASPSFETTTTTMRAMSEAECSIDTRARVCVCERDRWRIWFLGDAHICVRIRAYVFTCDDSREPSKEMC